MNRDEMDRMVGALRRAQELLNGSPGASDALRPALNVSYFIMESGHAHNFEDYLATFRGAPVPVVGAFSSREELDTWLRAHPVPPPRGAVELGGERYTLGYSRKSGQHLLLRLPSAADVRRPGSVQEQERLWLALDQAQAVLHSSPEDLKGLQCAALALHFVQESGCAQEFEHFVAHFDEPSPPLCSFTTWEEADAWLKEHPSPPHGATVRVGEDEFSVGYWPQSDHRVLLRAPTYEPLDDVEEEDEDPAS
ncbi:MAG TPA: hypothetical protein VFZ09_07430 [Archangium sp.]|uniref:hypothetical protein n=1 Tax=Archangium sp. TaxID=1872627 RepID=UPI002E2EF765|nr:hypothetical protein [Archangium sp.]HEX5746058.1 hypothetical protein [Archangium sp.]